MESKSRSCSPPVPSPQQPAPGLPDAGKGSSPSPASSQPSSGLFSTVFPTVNQMEARVAAKTEIFGPPPRKLENAVPSWNPQNMPEDGKYGYNPDREQRRFNKDNFSIYQSGRSGPCSLSNSLYYGGQDIYIRPPGTSYANKNDDEDDPANSDFASRGNWWQGSLYY